MEYADIIKIDLLGLEQIATLIARVPDRVLTLAEKVENPAHVPHLQEMSFDLFQGYYFARPQTISGKKLSATCFSKIKSLALLEQEDATPQDYTRLIERDPSIAFQLLRLLNSAAFCFSVKIKSIQHAISLLEMVRLKYWPRMVVLSDVGTRKLAPELYRCPLCWCVFSNC